MEIPFLIGRFAYSEIDSMMFFPTLAISLWMGGRNYLALLKSILVVAPLYLFWDFLATYRDSWVFNPSYVLGVYVYNLPVEEVLFFVVTPFATIMIYDFLRGRPDRRVKWGSWMGVVVGVLSILSSPLFMAHSYTFVDLLYLGMGLILTWVMDKGMLESLNFWKFMGLSYVPFMVFDFFLTALPVVEYGSGSILGVRVITIPVEDFMYSFSMLTLYTLFYRHFLGIQNTVR
ncbi:MULTISPECIES: lycopene cyclase domain-containing protein [Metallosphaera]|nr:MULTISPECIES: lycopene cyclase domain-containing protein [Metallosphaera]AKV74120.1 lycopene cyclase [Metallosphaera sedula]AKV76360.1 lycopene cyclase [Metallosphaera sedula]AKV78611.1 lycopene cyclase [Metallosphaera sedula]AKV80856.1 lycopene cyclase [Metallosphaera sedula]AKV83100.1 lycopene cyclase [Metallosphaera sedula]